MSQDTETARVFANQLNVDGQHTGATVHLTGTFQELPFDGLQKLTSNQYQFVIDENLALVAELPDDFVPVAGESYGVTGELQGLGEFGLFPGIKVTDVKTG